MSSDKTFEIENMPLTLNLTNKHLEEWYRSKEPALRVILGSVTVPLFVIKKVTEKNPREGKELLEFMQIIISEYVKEYLDEKKESGN